MQSGYFIDYPVQYTGFSSDYDQYDQYDQESYIDIPYNYTPQYLNMSSSRRGDVYDEICEYHCIEPLWDDSRNQAVSCNFIHAVTLQDYTPGRLTKSEINRLIQINTGFRCPAHEPALSRSNVLIQWEIPSPTLFSESAQLSRDHKIPILCPEKGCGRTFETRSEFKRHLAGIFRPFYCLRGNCCIDGIPCRKGFGRIEEVINHLKNENGQHHDAVRYRPVEGWDFRRKTHEETMEVLNKINFMPEEDLYAYYGISRY
ncbi:hypothetical protein H072_9056 [Dactylellina haptotyla CBS 200.50]|uniref:C2H2-type domain-containing protein n=1 Tax=Dactylellina haptotyla (strain CBS 200.50) TaxID=1284197 RepID=S8BDG1_DACHA|nr:hypothetical protein H072_9056 [Dactylellina haptotyla CBS 200.50]